MKTLRFEFPVMDAARAEAPLDLVARIPGVVAALVDAPAAALEVVVSGRASALLVREQVVAALLDAWSGAVAA